MCDFFLNLDDFFAVICTSFHEVVIRTGYVCLVNLPMHIYRSSTITNNRMREKKSQPMQSRHDGCLKKVWLVSD